MLILLLIIDIVLQEMTIKHHYSVNILITAIDSQLQDLNSRFSDKTRDSHF